MEELELTYLMKQVPEGLDKPQEIEDIYIPSSAAHPDLRIRKIGREHEITKKQPVDPGDSSRQMETTIPLTLDEYSELSQLKGKRIRKLRYYFNENGVNYEIDIFQGDLYGLILVDVEFDSIEQKGKFIPPSWLLAEVTQEKFIAGGMLAGKTYADIENELKKFGYSKLSL